MVENPFEMALFGDSFDQSLTQAGFDMSEELRMHIFSTADSVEASPLPGRPLDELGLLHGDRELDHDKRAFASILRSMAVKLDRARGDTLKRAESGGMFGGRGRLRSSCSRKKLPEIGSSYNPKRRATVAEADSLAQLQDMLDHEDVIKNIRSCSSYFDASCEQFKIMVRRFLG